MKFGFTYLLLFILFSCEVKLKEFDTPKNLLPKDSLALILEDIMVVEYQVQAKYPLPQQFTECVKKSGDTILAQYKVSYNRFDEAMTHYGSRQKEMQQIYDSILERLTKKLNRLQSGGGD